MSTTLPPSWPWLRTLHENRLAWHMSRPRADKYILTADRPIPLCHAPSESRSERRRPKRLAVSHRRGHSARAHSVGTDSAERRAEFRKERTNSSDWSGTVAAGQTSTRAGPPCLVCFGCWSSLAIAGKARPRHGSSSNPIPAKAEVFPLTLMLHTLSHAARAIPCCPLPAGHPPYSAVSSGARLTQSPDLTTAS